jgi:uncharacterized membrane protein
MTRRIIVITAMVLSIYGFCVLAAFAGSETAEHTNHVHSGDAGVVADVAKFIGWLGKFHPPVTHFPIALLIASAVAEVLFAKTGKILFDNARLYCLWFGIIGAVGAGTLGWFLAGFELVDKNWLLTTHRWLGSSTVVCSLLLGWVSWSGAKYGHSRLWYRLLLLLVVILVSATGFFGGTMLYGLDQYAW